VTLERTARFTVRPEELDRALETIGRFVAHTETEPSTLLYASWRSEARPYEFLHLMSFADAAAEQAHASSDAVRVFTEALYPMCAEPPTFEGWLAVWERGPRGEP
jgi:quinol monooxygenase YgiN